MHSPFRKRGVILAGLLALALAAVTPTPGVAKPEPGAKKPTRGFRLFSAPLGAMTINTIYCGLNSTGEVCVDSTNSSTVGGGFWPKGSANQYIFNSGLQIAGIIGPDGGAWAGDTTGAFFFDPKGTTQHGLGIQPVYNSQNPSDLSDWPAAAYVPSTGDSGASNFNPLLQGRKVASQGDVWFMSWDGDPSLNAGRKHPLGVAVETRGMGWNFPSGNQDIIYFIYTFYNITSTNPADYTGIRPEMQAILLDAANNFQAKNNAAFGVTLPAGGYTIENLYAAFATDMDVAQADVNYASVNLPFAVGFTYVQNFAGLQNWTFPAGVNSAPFFAGAGFAGIKYLKSPTGPGEIQLYSNTVNQTGFFNDPANTIQLYRYLSGNISVPAGDQPCNTGNPAISHVCFINNTTARDMRFFQSSSEMTLAPGGQGSIVVAYIFTAPVAVPGCPVAGNACGGGDLKPGNAVIMGNPTAMATGVNLVDSISGYLGFNDLDGDGKVEQSGNLGPEFTVVPGSLLGKSYTAQAVFDARFLLPFAPDAPKFFLIPGDNQVTVVWQPTPSEVTGDPYYSITQDVNSALYDPNYREFDVEGYRIYRGRVDSPDQLFLIKQFDYAGTTFADYDAVVNPIDTCAPELGITSDCQGVTYSPVAPGVPRTVARDYSIVSPFVQTKYGKRVALASGLAYVVGADTAVTGDDSGLPPMSNTEVPFSYVDNTARNNFRYFYVVTAFDVNSWTSGPGSLESPKSGTIAVVPQAAATNVVSQLGTTTQIMYGQRNNVPVPTNQYTVFPSVPSIDPVAGTFSGPQPPATFTLGFAAVVTQVLGNIGEFSARLDSLQLGQVDLTGCCGGADPRGGIPAVYFFRLGNATDSIKVAVSLQQTLDHDATTDVFLPGPSIDDSLAAIYGGDSTFTSMLAKFSPVLATSPQTGDQGLGAALDEPGFVAADFPAGTSGVNYNGARWFAGPSPLNNETTANPIAGSCSGGDGGTACAAAGTSNFNNAGSIPGVANINMPMAYSMFNREWRNVSSSQAGARRAADYNVYWGAPGVVDSVIDVTHNVPVPFDGDTVGGGWAILNTTGQGAGGFDNRPTVLTPTDWSCVEPLRSLQAAVGFFPCASAAPFNLDSVATLGSIAYGSGDNQSTSAAKSVKNVANIQANGGFMMYLAGTITGFDMTTLPTNTVWSLRDYVGVIYGGSGGTGGDKGPYTFRSAVRPFTAVGATMIFQYTVNNDLLAPTNAGLAKIHTIPDPYYVTNEYESDFTAKVIKFVNLPTNAIIRIYSSSGVLVRVLQYTSPENGGMLDWNVRNRSNQVVASGVYFYHVEAGDARFIGRMTIINFSR